jgi:MFS family permease
VSCVVKITPILSCQSSIRTASWSNRTSLTIPSLVEAPTFKKTFDNPSPTITGLIVAIYEVGCFIGSMITSIFGEQLGRKKCIGTGAVTMVIGALLQATAYSRAQMIVARVVSGIGMGGINSTVPVFQAEFSPKATRGLCKLHTLLYLNNTSCRNAKHLSW